MALQCSSHECDPCGTGPGGSSAEVVGEGILAVRLRTAAVLHVPAGAPAPPADRISVDRPAIDPCFGAERRVVYSSYGLTGGKWRRVLYRPRTLQCEPAAMGKVPGSIS
jgi:hypothetical protein